MNTYVKRISIDDAMSIDGTPGKITNYGLFVDDKLSLVLAVSASSDTDYQYELSLYGDYKYDNSLFKTFISDVNPISICLKYSPDDANMTALASENNFKKRSVTKRTNVRYTKKDSTLYRKDIVRIASESFVTPEAYGHALERSGYKKISKDISVEKMTWFRGGVVYKMTLPDGYFYIGSTTIDLDKYYGSGCELRRHMESNGYTIYDIKKEVLQDNFLSEVELRDAEKEHIAEYFSNNSDGSYFKIDDMCMNKQVMSSVDSNRVYCPECGGLNGHHKKTCSQYRKNKTCPECGSYTIHKKTCSHYKTAATCPECGGIEGSHKKTCSHYTAQKPCPECGGLNGCHKSWCSSARVCPECGATGNVHKKGCSHYRFTTSDKICQICGGRGGKHKATCPNKKVSICPECGGKGRHYKTCSHYNPPKPESTCPECGGLNGKHYKTCSRAIICPECGGASYNHKITCSQYKIKA